MFGMFDINGPWGFLIAFQLFVIVGAGVALLVALSVLWERRQRQRRAARLEASLACPAPTSAEAAVVHHWLRRGVEACGGAAALFLAQEARARAERGDYVWVHLRQEWFVLGPRGGVGRSPDVKGRPRERGTRRVQLVAVLHDGDDGVTLYAPAPIRETR